MKKSFIIKAPSIRLKKNLKTDYKSIFLFSLLICGIIIGTFIIKTGSTEFNAFIKTIVSNSLSVKLDSSIFTLFCSSLAISSLFLIYNYIFGLCGLGSVFISFSLFLFGVYLGFNIAFYYMVYSLNGLYYYISVNLPANAITAATLIKCCSDSYNTSKEIFYYIFQGKNNNKPLIKEYSLRYLIYIIPVSIGSFISALLFKYLGDLFSFIS